MTDTPVYEDLQISLVLGRGLVVDTAPQHTKVDLGLLRGHIGGIRLDQPGRIRIDEQVEYEITGYDTADRMLTLRLVHDWRPGQKDAPVAEEATEG